MSPAATSVAPSNFDYVAAVQHPKASFTIPELQRAEFETDFLGIPLAASGANAVVLKARVGDRIEALRCYTNLSAASKKRYAALARHRDAHGLTCVARSKLVYGAIRLHGKTWPVLRMEWVEGRALDQYVEYLVGQKNRAALAALADAWRELVKTLEAASFAHGDLQHGNVLIDTSSQLRLVDLDAVWVPELANARPPNEVGHPNYQHPARRETRRWDRSVDAFSALVIYLSLRALAVEPDLWHPLDTDDNLLFTAADFHKFDTLVWKSLAGLRQPEIDRMSETLKRCCDRQWAEYTSLEQLLAGVAKRPPRVPRPLGPVVRRRDRYDLPWEVEPVVPSSPPSAPEPTVVAASNVLPPPPKVSETTPVVETKPQSEPRRSWWEDEDIETLPDPDVTKNLERARRQFNRSVTLLVTSFVVMLMLLGSGAVLIPYVAFVLAFTGTTLSGWTCWSLRAEAKNRS